MTASKIGDGIEDLDEVLPDCFQGGYPWQSGFSRTHTGFSVLQSGEAKAEISDLYPEDGVWLRDAIRHAELSGVDVPEFAYARLRKLRRWNLHSSDTDFSMTLPAQIDKTPRK